MKPDKKGRAVNRQESGLLVEWMQGPEVRGRELPEVLVDGKPIGYVDSQIRLPSGVHRIAVRYGLLKTREYQREFRPGRLVILEYADHSARWRMLPVKIVLGLMGLLTLWRFPYLDERSSDALTVVLLLGLMALTGIAWVRVSGRHFVTLRPYIPSAEDIHGSDDTLPRDPPRPEPLRSGRVLINLVVAPVSGGNMTMQPSRPRVLIDGKDAGNVSRVFRVIAGYHRVRVRGWFDCSDELNVYVPAGGLVEIEAEQSATGVLAMLVIAAAAVVSFFLEVSFMLAWPGMIFAGLISTAGLALFALSRLCPTMKLTVGSYR